MCGRYVTPEVAEAERNLMVHWLEYERSWNVVPSQRVPVVRWLEGARQGLHMRWGLVPYFARGVPPKYSTINATIERLQDGACWKGPWQRGQRCALPDSEREAEAATVDAFEECAQSVIEALSTSLEHIPVVKIGVALVKVSASIRDQIVARKIMDFLRALDSVPAEQRREMIARLESDPEYGRHVGQHVVELLDRVDSHRKPAMIGAIFGARAKELIDLRMLYRLTDAVERLSVMEIDGVRRFKRWYDNRPNVPPGTGGSGFSITELSHAGFTHVQSLVGGLGYSPNEVCIAFLDLNLDQVR